MTILATASADLRVTLGSVTLKNPVLTAAGTYGYGHDIQPAATMARLGAICTKGLSLKPRAGNPPPRIRETRGGLLNAIGLENMGIEAFLKEVLPLLKKAGVTVFVNIFSEDEEEFAVLGRMLRGETAVTAIELNLSCPNVKRGGIAFGKDPQAIAKITSAVAATSNLPVFVKLTPEAPSITEAARAAISGGACGVTAVNTFRALAIDHATGRPYLSTIFGGLSGPAIKPIAMRMVFEIYRDLSVPIIASGGIVSAGDAIEYLMAGATAVGVGTASLADAVAGALVSAAEQGELTGVILDLRVAQSSGDWPLVPLLSLFGGGELGEFYTRSRSFPLTVTGQDIAGSQSIPLVILVGRDTRGSPEVFASALQAAGRASVVGWPTDGDVLGFRQLTLLDGTQLVFASQSFRTPDGMDLSRTGVTPDVRISADWDEVSPQDDPVLEAAQSLLAGNGSTAAGIQSSLRGR